MNKFSIGDLVVKVKGSEWIGRVVGTYSSSFTKEGYVIESIYHTGSCQIYPADALSLYNLNPPKDISPSIYQTIDGVTVKPGDRVFVYGAFGAIKETTVAVPLTNYCLGTLLRVDESYYYKDNMS